MKRNRSFAMRGFRSSPVPYATQDRDEYVVKNTLI